MNFKKIKNILGETMNLRAFIVVLALLPTIVMADAGDLQKFNPFKNLTAKSQTTSEENKDGLKLDYLSKKNAPTKGLRCAYHLMSDIEKATSSGVVTNTGVVYNSTTPPAVAYDSEHKYLTLKIEGKEVRLPAKYEQGTLSANHAEYLVSLPPANKRLRGITFSKNQKQNGKITEIVVTKRGAVQRIPVAEFCDGRYESTEPVKKYPKVTI